MLKLVATWLIISQPSQAAMVGDYRLAPPTPPWPAGLHAPERRDGGIWLPADMAQAVHGRLLFLDQFPRLCQSAMDGEADVLTTQCSEQRRVDAATAQAASDQRAASAEAHRMTFAKGAAIAGVTAAITAALMVWAESKGKHAP